ncbi:MAG: acetylserotonin O-methyltransferase [Desulfobacteraceae bacterium]|nr:acetylserotonin O-methyltransferase [Desulfobacteraceae bacterium]
MEHKDIMSVSRAFMRSRILLSAAELDLFTTVDSGYATAERIAGRVGCDARAVARVLECLVTFGFLEKRGETFLLTEAGGFFSSKHPQSSLPMLLHQCELWKTWSGLTEIVKNGPAAELTLPRAMDPESRRSFIGAMHVVGRNLSEEIVAGLDVGRFKKLLDIGGASGTYTIAFLRNNPQMRAILFDMGDVIGMARERLSAEGFLGRTELVAGDFYKDELPTGCDLTLLSAIIHQNSPEQNVRLYAKAFRALQPGGMILIRDHIMNESRTWPPEGALFAINMLVNTRGGDTYTFAEVEEGLREAGFRDTRLLRNGERMDCVVGAVKPE